MMKLNQLVHCTVALAIVCLPLSSCNTILADSGLATLTGAGLGAGIGAMADSHNRGRGAAIGGVVGGFAGFLLSKHYQATQAQIRYAEQQAAAAARRNSTKSKLQANKTRYVAVPVKPSTDEQKKSNAKNLLMVYDTEKQELVDQKVYTPSKKSYSSGEVTTIGGRKTIVASSFSGI